MFSRCVATLIIVVTGHMLTVPPVRAQETTQSEREAMYYRYLEFASYVKGGLIELNEANRYVEPHWMADGSSFWYAEGAPANTVIFKIDPEANTKTPLFDTARLRQALTLLLGHEPPYEGLPFDQFTFMDDAETAIRFTLEGKDFMLELDTYVATRAPVQSEEEKSRFIPQVWGKALVGGTPISGEIREVLSPDRRWFAGIKNRNLSLRSTYDGRTQPLTTDGIEDYFWTVDDAHWSPNSLKLAVKKIDARQAAKMPLVHWLGPIEEVEWVYPHRTMTGGPMRQPELFVVDILSRRQIRVDTGEERNQYLHVLGWLPDGSELLFLRVDRWLKNLQLMAADPNTGAARVILSETQKTFVVGLQLTYRGWIGGVGLFTLLPDGRRFIWMSERDGWNHLYLYDLDGSLIRQLTEGRFPVMQFVAVDEKEGWVYFAAHGDPARAYDQHLYRVNLEGKDFTRLTEAPGFNEVQFAPSKRFFLNTHSSVERPPAVELRTADGTLLQTLSKANIDAQRELEWKPPEEFVVKAADGKTDLYGVLYKPYDFDPSKKYPVIEHIYAGPQSRFIPWFMPDIQSQALAQLGFVVFHLVGRGTPGRGKEFQDVVYGNFGRHEIPDHVAALKQLAEERPYLDLGRVGIYGGSSGGYFTIRAMLLAPDVYHVGIASAPVVEPFTHGNRIEMYMGPPSENKDGYEYFSNLRFAHQLEGKLLLIHGTSDLSASFSHTMKMIEALIRAGKPYDLIVLPEQDHSVSYPILSLTEVHTYWGEAIRRYFQEHLKPELGSEPGRTGGR
ncbi:MAG: DPP IV N-terminal domain-containing protein [Bacteroidetes bacterium]|nr:DPP IV N-terminal domain-containing protein [Bacteroidota bacterium]